jgi:hypothetical protein
LYGELVRAPVFDVDSELSCPVLVAHQMSATSGFVLPRGRGGQAGGLSMPSTRRAAERI